MFITFEGLDCSGKTTQAQFLCDRLKEERRDFMFLREPGGTEISDKIRAILLDRDHLEMTQIAELFLFSAARTQLVSEVIHPSLEAGRIVVCDRFYDSTTAYQGYGRGLNLETVKKVNTVASLGIAPDLTFVLDIELGEIGRRRAAGKLTADRMEGAGAQFYEKVRHGYLQIAKVEPKRCIAVNGMKPRQEIHEEIWNIVQKKL